MYSDLIFDYLQKNNIEVTSEFDDLGLKKNSYEIKNDRESKEFGKPIGKYELLTIRDVLEYTNFDKERCVDFIYNSFYNMIGDIDVSDRILVVGLGNRHISPDSLGAKVVGGINVTIENKHLPKVMAICPSVMGLTGIETSDIIEGVCKEVKPTHIIIIDSLCAGSIERLGRSIQITNTGICPGAGIGNKRKCIGKNIAKNVYSIGVPLLIYASTFITETLEKNNINFDLINGVMHEYKKTLKNTDIFNVLSGIKGVINENLDNTIVSLKDIEECVSIIANLISRALNRVLLVDM